MSNQPVNNFARRSKWQKNEFWLWAAPLLVLLVLFAALHFPKEFPLQVKIVRPLNWTMTYKEKQNDAMLDFNRVTIIFQDVIAADKVLSSSTWVSSGSMSWQGNTYSSAALGAGQLPFTKRSGRGVTHISFAGHNFRIEDAGPRVVFGSQTFAISGSKRTIVVRKDGIAQWQD